MRQGELEALLGELLDVWSADVGGLLDLNDLEDLEWMRQYMLQSQWTSALLTWMVLKRARWREAISW